MRFIKPDINIPFLQNRKLFYVISTTLIIVSIVSIAVRGINFGIDFSGGYELQVKFPEPVDVARVKSILRSLNMGEPVVQRFGDEENNEYLIRIKKSKSVDSKALQKVENTIAQISGKENLTDFHYSSESGERVQIEFDTPIEQEQIEQAFESHGLSVQNTLASTRQDKPLFTVIIKSVHNRISDLLHNELKIDKGHKLIIRDDFVGPQVGKQLRNQGIMAVLYAMVFILIYIAVRFDFYFSPGAVVALFHDVIITVGIFSIFGIEFNLPIIGALLTIVGYSLNDTIVIYDRVRENLTKLRGRELVSLVNTSINETLSRTLLTSATTLVVVLALFVFGGGIIHDFSFALLIGVLIGTYSSVAVAAPVYLDLRKQFKKAEAK